MTAPTQFLLFLDVDNPVDEAQFDALVPDRRSVRHTLRLSDSGLEPQPGRRRDELDWAGIVEALASLRSRLIAKWPEDGNVEVYVAGFAPLPVFFAAGAMLDTRTSHVFALQPDRERHGDWTLLDLSKGEAPSGLIPSGLPKPPAVTTGNIALFISTQVAAAPVGPVREAVKEIGGELGAIASLTSADRTVVDQKNIGRLFTQLREFFVAVTEAYPDRSGVTLFLAGPAAMALAAGLAMNVNQFFGQGRVVDLCEYLGGPYKHVLRLPLDVASSDSVPDDAEAVLRRTRAFGHFRRGVAALQTHLERETLHLPVGFAASDEVAAKLGDDAYRLLTGLTVPDEPVGDAFEVDVLASRLTVGHGLLHALSDVSPDTLSRLGQMFTLHEVLHPGQGIESYNFRGIGRSGVALEDVDFWADAFAIATATTHEVLRNGAEGEARCGESLLAFINAHIEAMRAFDRMEQGIDQLRVMPERRLRRYLIWYLQRARAVAVRSPTDVRAMLDTRLFVELAPLRGRLDRRYDKIVVSPVQTTTLTVVSGGRACRIPALPLNFDPADLVEAVRTFDEEALANLMDYVVNKARDLLVTWG